MAAVEAAIAASAPRPHWGKVFTMTPPPVPQLRQLAAELDPHGIFANDFTEKYL